MYYMTHCPTWNGKGAKPPCMSGKSKSWKGCNAWSFTSADTHMLPMIRGGGGSNWRSISGGSRGNGGSNSSGCGSISGRISVAAVVAIVEAVVPAVVAAVVPAMVASVLACSGGNYGSSGGSSGSSRW
jgi:hypothetical protein